jgi:hypothetical protein
MQPASNSGDFAWSMLLCHSCSHLHDWGTEVRHCLLQQHVHVHVHMRTPGTKCAGFCI